LALKLFLGALLVYNLNCRPIPSGDTVTTALLPLQLVLHGRFDFDNCQPLLQQYFRGDTYFLHPKNGHYYSSYAVAQPLLLTPLYLPLALAPGARNWPASTEVLVARILEKLMGVGDCIGIGGAPVSVAAPDFERTPGAAAGRGVRLRHQHVEHFQPGALATRSKPVDDRGQPALPGAVSARSEPLAGCGGSGAVGGPQHGHAPHRYPFFGASLAVLLWLRRPWLLLSYAGFGTLIGGSLAFHNLRLFGGLRGPYTLPFDGNF
jgi:hypothetical protein